MNHVDKQVAFLGLGVMGYPMAGHLAQAGLDVTIYNRTTSKSDQWSSDYSGEIAATPKQAVATASLIFSCVGNDDDLRKIAYGDQGILSGLRPGSVWVDHTTTSAEVAREMQQALAALDCSFLDAPVSGGQVGAETGKLTIMVGGRWDTSSLLRRLQKLDKK